MLPSFSSGHTWFIICGFLIKAKIELISGTVENDAFCLDAMLELLCSSINIKPATLANAKSSHFELKKEKEKKVQPGKVQRWKGEN